MLTLIKDALLKQGQQSKGEDIVYDSFVQKGKCAYRGANGLKCAVGLFITDYEYKPEMEHRTAIGIHNEYPDLGLWEMMPSYMWDKVQNIHDVTPLHKTWSKMIEEEMAKLIEDYPEYA